MSEAVTIEDGHARLTVLPALGAGIARYDLIGAEDPMPVFRPAPDLTTENPFQLACNLLVPWSNRISRGGFSFAGRFHPLEPNLRGEPFPIHGNGFQIAWRVTDRSPGQVTLETTSDGPGPFRYDATASYVLEEGALRVTLTVVNRAALPLPFGAGFHPWFLRDANTMLTAPARLVWLEDERHLPTGSLPTDDRPDWKFASPRPLPSAWINNGFSGWPGQAAVDWPGRGLRLAIKASPELANYLVYAPTRDAGFFCFEPVTHVVDAHHLQGMPGLHALEPGQHLQVWCHFAPTRYVGSKPGYAPALVRGA